MENANWYCIQLSGLGEREQIRKLKTSIFNTLKIKNILFFFPVRNANNKQPYNLTESILSGYFFFKADKDIVKLKLIELKNNLYFSGILLNWKGNEEKGVSEHYINNLRKRLRIFNGEINKTPMPINRGEQVMLTEGTLKTLPATIIDILPDNFYRLQVELLSKIIIIRATPAYFKKCNQIELINKEKIKCPTDLKVQ